jgi:hypothetical protein
MSPPVDRIKNSIVGDVARIKDEEIQKIRSKFFDNGLFNANPNEINFAFKKIRAVDPKAADGILREEFRTRIQNRVKDQVFTITNRPSEFLQAISGTKGRDIAVLKSAMNSEQRKRYNYLIKGLERQAKGRPGGSQTDV